LGCGGWLRGEEGTFGCHLEISSGIAAGWQERAGSGWRQEGAWSGMSYGMIMIWRCLHAIVQQSAISNEQSQRQIS
jgi:hypothetical protein